MPTKCLQEQKNSDSIASNNWRVLTSTLGRDREGDRKQDRDRGIDANMNVTVKLIRDAGCDRDG